MLCDDSHIPSLSLLIRFAGSQPVAFMPYHLQSLQREDYFVCEKSDGVRYLMLIMVTQKGPATFMVKLIPIMRLFFSLPAHYVPRYRLTEKITIISWIKYSFLSRSCLENRLDTTTKLFWMGNWSWMWTATTLVEAALDRNNVLLTYRLAYLAHLNIPRIRPYGNERRNSYQRDIQ